MVASRGWFYPGVFGIVCLLTFGCGPRVAPVTGKVEGTLTWRSVPLAGMRVQFVPQVEPGVKASPSSGVTDEKGFFRLTLNDTGKPGAVIGRHKVVLYSGRMSGGERSKKDGEEEDDAQVSAKLPSVYSSISQTPFEIDVTPEQTEYKLVVPNN